MNLFNIYIKKSEDETIKDLFVVKSGFSYLAFIFGPFWFLQHKMWKESIIFISVNILLILALQKISLGTLNSVIIETAYLLFVGINAFYWFEKNLIKCNYQFIGSVFGKNKDEAKLRFISNCFKDKKENNIFHPSILSF